MSFKSDQARVSRAVKMDLAAIDAAIALAHRHDAEPVAVGLRNVRDFIARSDAYFRRVSDGLSRKERRERERFSSDIRSVMREDMRRGRR